MSDGARRARKWTCSQCRVSASSADGKPIPLPDTWTSATGGRLCLVCRRERAALVALESAPSGSPLSARAKIRRAALVEFEVRRTPSLTNGAIAKACRSSIAAVAEARKRLQLPAPPRVSGRG
jgi:hypothetical protein